jgi:hypothetical protein
MPFCGWEALVGLMVCGHEVVVVPLAAQRGGRTSMLLVAGPPQRRGQMAFHFQFT